MTELQNTYLNNYIKTGDQILMRSNSLYSKLIHLIKKDKWSHIGTVVILDEFPFILETNLGTDARLIDFHSAVENKKWTPLRLKHSLEYEFEFINDLNTLVNKKYELFVNLIKLGLELKLQKDFSKSTCSELSGYIMEIYHTLDKINYSKLRPQHFLEIKKLKELFI